MRVHTGAHAYERAGGGAQSRTQAPEQAHMRAPMLTLFTLLTTQSSASPLKGRNVTHPKRTRKVARPLPSARIFPWLGSKMFVTHTM